MTKLIVGAVYQCSDGDIHKLTKIEDDFLSYSVPIHVRENGSYVWMDLGRTHRLQVEGEFINGTII